MIQAYHGVLDITGVGLIANLIGVIVFALAGFGIAGARAQNVLTFWLGVALVPRHSDYDSLSEGVLASVGSG